MVPTFEDEGVPRVPKVVKHPLFPIKLEKYPTGIARFGDRVISEYVDRTLVNFRWLAAERTPICSPKGKVGEISVEVGVLRETETSLAFKMAKIPKNFC